jgi:hypothetical protein
MSLSYGRTELNRIGRVGDRGKNDYFLPRHVLYMLYVLYVTKESSRDAGQSLTLSCAPLAGTVVRGYRSEWTICVLVCCLCVAHVLYLQF